MELFFRSFSSGGSRYQVTIRVNHVTDVKGKSNDFVSSNFCARLETSLTCLNEITALLRDIHTAPLHLLHIVESVHTLLSDLKQCWSLLLEKCSPEPLQLILKNPSASGVTSEDNPCPSVRRSVSVPQTLPLTPQTAVETYLSHIAVNVNDHLSLLKGALVRLKMSAGEDVEQKAVNSVYRYQTQLLVLRKEVQTFIPNVKEGVFNWRFRCAKPEVESWWQSRFGDNFILDWSDFMTTFSEYFKLENASLIQEIQKTINFCNTDYISKFNFDLFTRLFPPWSKLTQVWKAIVLDHPGYFGMANYEEARDSLVPYLDRPGSYIFRYSATRFGFWSIAYVKRDKTVAHVLLRDMTLVEALTTGAKQKIYRYPHGRSYNPDVSHLLEFVIPIPAEALYGDLSMQQNPLSPPTSEPDQYNLGSADTNVISISPNTSAEQPHESAEIVTSKDAEVIASNEEAISCKICFEKKKDTQLEPCLHFLCSTCFSKWMSHQDNCPFCREPVRSFRRVVLHCANPSLAMNSHALSDPSSSISRSSHRGMALPPLPESTPSSDPNSNSCPPPLPPRLNDFHRDI